MLYHFQIILAFSKSVTLKGAHDMKSCYFTLGCCNGSLKSSGKFYSWNVMSWIHMLYFQLLIVTHEWAINVNVYGQPWILNPQETKWMLNSQSKPDKCSLTAVLWYLNHMYKSTVNLHKCCSSSKMSHKRK